MQFPVYLWIGPVALHPHFVFECLAYLVGTRLYTGLRARQGDALASDDRWTIVAAAAVGAAIGSKLLYWVAEPGITAQHWSDPVFLLGGKSVVGGLVGGLLAVEWTKRRVGITRSTGDLFAIPLAVGIGVGRIGCFLTGLDDHTHGVATTLAWAVDYGDGVLRHPTQVYEIAFVWGLAVLLVYLGRLPHHEGDLFKSFMVAYLGFRLLLEFIKPGTPLLGLNPIQWVCLAVLLWYGWSVVRSRHRLEVAASG